MNKPQKWLSVTVRAAGSAREAIENYMFELGSCGTEDLPGAFRCYFAEPWEDESLRSLINNFIQEIGLSGFSCSAASYEIIGIQDWGAGWKKYFKPVKVGARFIVKPPWEAVTDKDRLIIDINPALAFGTGTHETTQLVMELMEKEIFPNCRVLDAGTGSGVLAISAVKLGADSVIGFDIDQDALQNAAENAELNGVSSRINFICGNLDSLEVTPRDIIFANINRKVLVKLIPNLKLFMTEETVLILSGILIEDHHHIQTVLHENYLNIEDCFEKGDWEALSVRMA